MRDEIPRSYSRAGVAAASRRLRLRRPAQGATLQLPRPADSLKASDRRRRPGFPGGFRGRSERIAAFHTRFPIGGKLGR